ncbi:MAG TPA: chloride channel protein [Burkholderiaceae bacterium]|nr:chloride channel protein [Burkholderiaceae bacterium]
MKCPTRRTALRSMRRTLMRLDTPWRHLVVAAAVGALGALAVLGFKQALFALESLLVGASGGHLVSAAQKLPPDMRLWPPALGALAAGLLLWFAERGRAAAPPGAALRHGGDYIEAVAIGSGRLDLRDGLLKVAASMLVVSTGGAVGREGAMVLLAAMLASVLGRFIGRGADLRLVVSCGAAAGLAAAYHAPLAGALFVAEILLGSLALAQLGPVVVAAVMAYGVTVSLGERSVLFPLAAVAPPGLAQVGLVLGLSMVGGLLGAGLLHWLRGARTLFVRLRLPQPAAFALGGLVVGVLSLWRPEVWGNGYSIVQQQLTSPAAWSLVAMVLALKLLAIGATTGSGAPGGVFTPTLFVGAAVGSLAASALAGLGATAAPEPLFAAVGMAVLLAATTHAPVMSALMVFEMTGQYALLPLLLPACVIAALVSRRFAPLSVYGLRGAGRADAADSPP